MRSSLSRCGQFLIALLALCVSTAEAMATEWVVSVDGSGQFADIQSAVDVASDGDTITVLPGVYVAAAGADYVVDISNKTLYIVAAAGPSQTRIDGQYQRGCLRWTGQGASPGLIQGFKLWAGAVGTGEGGGLRLENASPAVETCEIQNCSAKFGGGAYLKFCDASFESCQFLYSTATDKGGGLYGHTSNYSLTSCNVSMNTAADRGGAIRNWISQPIITDCTFSYNTGGARGGAIHAQNNSGGTFVECDFIDNTCTSLGGAVVDNGGSDSSYYNCTFANNESTGANGGQGRGGATFSDSSFVLFDGCTFDNNTASSVGGAIYNWNCAGACIGGSITGNIASDGGAIYTYHAGFSQDIAGTSVCDNSLPQIYGGWTDLGGACVADNCADLVDDDDGDGIPNGCDPCPDWPYECSSDGQTITVQPGQDIQLAIDASVSGGVVVLAAGVHAQAGISFGGAALTLRGEVSQTGDLLTTLSQSGQGALLIFNSGETAAARVESLKFQSASGGANGGAIHITGGSPTIEDCEISQCSSSQGAGIFLNDGSPSITQCTFSDNYATYGGAVYSSGETSQPVFTNCLFDGNHAGNKAGAVRGYSFSSMTFNDCDFTRNTAGVEGGAIHVYGGAAVQAVGCVLSWNTAPYGGAAAMVDATGLFNGTDFISNTASTEGGALYLNDTEPWIDGCEFVQNGSDTGGAIRSVNVVDGPNLINSVLCGNTPDHVAGPWQAIIVVGGRQVVGGNCFASSCVDGDKDGIIDGCDPDPPGNGIDGPLADGSWVLWNNAPNQGGGISWPCAVDGDLAAIVAVGRGVCIYRRTPETGNWAFDAWLNGDGIVDTDPLAFFGRSVDISGSYVAIGAPGRDPDGTGNRSGSVYIYHTSGPGQWSLEQEYSYWTTDGALLGQKVAFSTHHLLAAAPGVPNVISIPFGLRGGGSPRVLDAGGAQFGQTLAADGDYVVIGSVPQNGAGSDNTVSIFRVAAGTGFELEAQFTSALTLEQGFGRTVSIDASGVCAVATGGLRQVLIFRRDVDGAWSQDAQFGYGAIPGGLLGQNLGTLEQDVLVRGNDLLVAGGEMGGLIRRYRYSHGAEEWVEQDQIVSIVPTGLNIDVDGDTLISSSPFSTAPGSSSTAGNGVAVLLARTADGGWGSDARPPLPVVMTDVELQTEGWAQAVFDSANVATCTADGWDWAFITSGEIQDPAWDVLRIYRRESGGWVYKQTIGLEGGTGQWSVSLAAEGNHLAVGLFSGSDDGRVDLYTVQSDGQTWAMSDQVTGGDLQGSGWLDGGRLGASVAIDGDVVAMGSTCYSGGLCFFEPGGAVLARINSSDELVPVAAHNQPAGYEGEHMFGWATAVRVNPDSTATVAVGAMGDGNGRVYVFELGADDVLTHLDTLEAPTTGGVSDFGREVQLAGDHLAVGCLMSEAGQHGAVLYDMPASVGSWVGQVQGPGLGNAYAQLRLRNRLALTADGVLAMGVPMLSHTASQGGGCLLFHNADGVWSDPVLLAPRQGQLSILYQGIGGMRLGLGVAIIGSEVIVGGTPGSDPVALSFALDSNRAYWTATQESQLNASSAWSKTPLITGTGVFAQWPSDGIDVQWRNSVVADLEVTLCEVSLDFNNTPIGGRSLSGDLLLAGPTDMGIGRLRIGQPGQFSVGGSTVVGQGDLSGRLALRGGATLHTSQLTIAPNSAMDIDLYSSNSVTTDAPPSIAGTLRVSLGDMSPSGLEEGDSFTVIQSSAAPLTGAAKFDLIVLPGLPDGLAFQTEYVEGLRGGWVVNVNVVSLAGLLNFGSPANLPVTGQPTAVEVVDLTGDGAEEICVTFAGSPGQLMIFENDGAGGVAQQIVLPTGDMPVDVTSGDFDGDLRMDLAVANNLSLDVTLYFNDDEDPANGMVIEDLDVGAPPTCLAGINANFDAAADLVVGLADTDGDGNGFWAIYTGTLGVRGAGPGGGMTGGGGLATGGEPVFGDPSDDEDQKTIIFFGGTSTGRADVGKNNSVPGLQGLSLSIDHYDAGADPQGLTHADLNGDGHDDIILSSGLNGSMAVLLADPTMPSTFLPALQIPIGDSPTRVTAVDFDQDGNMDLAVIVDSDGDSRVRVLQNDGNMAFTTIDTAEDEGVVLLDSGDISGNGVSELVTIGDGSALRGMGDPILSLRPLNSSTTCAGDADATGFVNIEDLLVVLSEFGSCPAGCAADFDDDGDVDIDDMLVVIGNWGPCPRQ